MLEQEPAADAVPSAVFDPARLAAVEASGLVDSPPDEAFDRLAALAAQLLDTPLAFVTAVDTERSWYKSFIGGPDDAQRWGYVEESFCQYVVGSGRECIIDDARADPRTRRNPAIESMGVVAWAGFPVHSPSGEVLGTLCVVDTKPRTWSRRDVQVLDTLSSAASAEVALRMALAEERVQRGRAEDAAEALERTNAALEESAAHATALATTLSATLLPPRLSSVDGLDIATRYRLAEAQTVTGDFYDVFAVDDDWAVIIGDVVGKGPAAATYTAEVRYSVRAEAARSHAPSEVLTAVNRVLHTYAEQPEQFATAAYATLRHDGDTWDVQVALAGHLQPLLRRASGDVEEVGIPGLPLGLFDDPEVTDQRIRLEVGDALVFFTDGVEEARRGAEEFGGPRLLDLVGRTSATSAGVLADAIMDAVADFAEGVARDDIAVMVLQAT